MMFNGAKAKIYLKYKGSIEEVSSLLSKGIILPDFYFDTDMDPPHNVTGHCEALGFSIWLDKLADDHVFDYILEIETNMSMEESYHALLCDISPWMARYVSAMCELETTFEI